MLSVVFKDLPLRDCLQYITKRKILLNHFLLSMARYTYAIVTDLGLYPFQHTPPSIMAHTCPVKCASAMVCKGVAIGKQKVDRSFCRPSTNEQAC